MQDIYDRAIPSRMYGLHSIMYYLGPFLFTLVVLLDLFMAPPLSGFTPLMSLMWMIVGMTGIVYLRHLIKFRGVPWIAGPFYAVTGMFLLYPLTLYAALTIRQQGRWMTR